MVRELNVARHQYHKNALLNTLNEPFNYAWVTLTIGTYVTISAMY